MLIIYFKFTMFLFIIFNALIYIKFATCVLIDNVSIYTLSSGEILHYYNDSNDYQLQIYCDEPQKKSIISLWNSITVNVLLNDEDEVLSKYYLGNSTDDVKRRYDDRDYVFDFQLPFRINPFESFCIGLSMQSNYSISFVLNAVDERLAAMTIFGLLLFLYCDWVSNSRYFYYGFVVSLGTALFFIVPILYFVKNKILLGGTAVTSGFMVYHFWNLIYSTVKPILFTYKNQIGIYVALSAVINFLLCYRFVLPVDERTKNINKWMLRIVGLLLIYYSSYLTDITLCMIMIILTFCLIYK